MKIFPITQFNINTNLLSLRDFDRSRGNPVNAMASENTNLNNSPTALANRAKIAFRAQSAENPNDIFDDLVKKVLREKTSQNELVNLINSPDFAPNKVDRGEIAPLYHLIKYLGTLKQGITQNHVLYHLIKCDISDSLEKMKIILENNSNIDFSKVYDGSDFTKIKEYALSRENHGTEFAQLLDDYELYGGRERAQAKWNAANSPLDAAKQTLAATLTEEKRQALAEAQRVVTNLLSYSKTVNQIFFDELEKEEPNVAVLCACIQHKKFKPNTLNHRREAASSHTYTPPFCALLRENTNAALKDAFISFMKRTDLDANVPYRAEGDGYYWSSPLEELIDSKDSEDLLKILLEMHPNIRILDAFGGHSKTDNPPTKNLLKYANDQEKYSYAEILEEHIAKQQQAAFPYQIAADSTDDNLKTVLEFDLSASELKILFEEEIKKDKPDWTLIKRCVRRENFTPNMTIKSQVQDGNTTIVSSMLCISEILNHPDRSIAAFDAVHILVARPDFDPMASSAVECLFSDNQQHITHTQSFESLIDHAPMEIIQTLLQAHFSGVNSLDESQDSKRDYVMNAIKYAVEKKHYDKAQAIRQFFTSLPEPSGQRTNPATAADVALPASEPNVDSFLGMMNEAQPRDKQVKISTTSFAPPKTFKENEALIEKIRGNNVNLRKTFHETAMALKNNSSAEKYDEILLELVKNPNFDLNKRYDADFSIWCNPLFILTTLNKPYILQEALNRDDADINIQSGSDKSLSPLSRAVSFNLLDCAYVILTSGKTLNDFNRCKKRAQSNDMMCAMFDAYPDVEKFVKSLETAEAEVKKVNTIRDFLLSPTLDPTAVDKEKNNVIHLANYLDDEDEAIRVIELASKRGVNLKTKNNNGEDPIDVAVKCKKYKIIAYLAVKKAADGYKDENDENLLVKMGLDPNEEKSLAVIYGLDLGKMSVNAKTAAGSTFLINCAKLKHYEKMKFALTKGANIDAQDEFGQTALHWACAMQDEQAIDFLFNNFADMDIRDSAGKLPIEYLKQAALIQKYQQYQKALGGVMK